MMSPKYSELQVSPEREWSHEVSVPSTYLKSTNWLDNHTRNAKRPWKLSTLILSVLLCISLSSNLLGTHYRPCARSTTGIYETGFETDLKAVRDEIELIEYAFEGGVQLDNAGEYKSNPSKYVGSPNSHIDREWRILLTGLNMDLPSAEAEGIENKTYNWENTDLYFSGLGVLHSLHCLNRIRQAFYPDYYHVFDDPTNPPREMHIDHCLDHIRQALQCHSDLTPMEWTRKGDSLILATNSVHTCRNFVKVHEWVSKRKIVLGKHVGGEKLKIID